MTVLGDRVFKEVIKGTSLVVQWLRLCTFRAGDEGSIPGQGTRVLHAGPHGQNEKTNQQKTKSRKKNKEVVTVT